MISGIYVISPAFAGNNDEVSFTFKGRPYTATMGVQAFASFEDAMAVSLMAPVEPFDGQLYDTPVLLMPAGTYAFGKSLSTFISQPVTILGEGAASRTEGSFYRGTFAIPEGTPGCITVDGLTLYNTRVHDRRTASSIGIKMCISGVRMGGSVLYRDGLTLNIQVGDFL